MAAAAHHRTDCEWRSHSPCPCAVANSPSAFRCYAWLRALQVRCLLSGFTTEFQQGFLSTIICYLKHLRASGVNVWGIQPSSYVQKADGHTLPVSMGASSQFCAHAVLLHTPLRGGCTYHWYYGGCVHHLCGSANTRYAERGLDYLILTLMHLFVKSC